MRVLTNTSSRVARREVIYEEFRARDKGSGRSVYPPKDSFGKRARIARDVLGERRRWKKSSEPISSWRSCENREASGIYAGDLVSSARIRDARISIDVPVTCESVC